MPQTGLKGVLSPVVTPVDEEMKPDVGRWIAHCRWLLSQNCGLAVFGTNSEANSFSLDERLGLLDAGIESGLDPSRMMPGTGACAIPDAVTMTRRAVEHGCAGILMLPPFYYKGVSDDGLFAFFERVIQEVGDDRLRVYLYHIPQVSQVPISLDLIERLLAAYPGVVAGIKDSSGDWSNTKAMLERFENFDVFAGSETFLLDTMRGGGAGCISATANINPAAIHDVYANWTSNDAKERQRKISEFREAVSRFPMIPALKAAVSWATGIESWRLVRPPLTPLDADTRKSFVDMLEERGFSMPGIEQPTA
ncbi:dihydrodipicolinate synthase family protein [Rhodobacteraceae bacterium WD3A24]|nr:dihydrodipicolinate synthase family protein [Rhodobacteraceae bacterium WD3A24]